MATHEFGIMARDPVPGRRYDAYEPEKYHCIAVDDSEVEPLAWKAAELDVFWHTPDWPRRGLNYCGITLLPPDSVARLLEIVENAGGPEALQALLRQAQRENRYVIHYGL